MEHVGDISDCDIDGMFATNVMGLIGMTQLLVKRTVIHYLSALLDVNSLHG